MKSIYKYMLGALVVGSMASCSPEEFDGADLSNLPTIEANHITVEVDQETNTMTAKTEEIPGQYLIWYIDDVKYSSLATISYSNLEAGTHSLTLKVGNRNGIANASKSAEFTFNETKVDFSIYFNKLVDKTWRVSYTEKGHLGCGESGTDGSNWWSASPNDKADWGVYDDRITFAHSDSDGAAEGTYTYNPGEGGTVYVNKGCTVFSEYNPHDDNDFMAPVEEMSAKFTLVPDKYNGEDCLFIQFAPQTLLPYVPNDDTYNNPLYRIESITSNTLALVCDNGEIAWRMVLTSKEDEGMPTEPEVTMDWDVNSAQNLWTIKSESDLASAVETWWADGGWQQLPSPSYTYENGELSLTAVENGGSQWQAQVKLHTNISAVQAKKYDFYCVVEADEDVKGATIKLTQDGDDENYFFGDRHDVTGGKLFVYKIEGVSLAKAADAPKVMLVFDFGGAAVGTKIKVHDIYFAENISMDPADEDNLWTIKSESDLVSPVTFWWADGGWQQLTSPTYTFEDGVLSFTAVENGGSQWQAQVALHTNIPAELASTYNFACKIETDDDVAGVTIKLTQSDESATNKHDDNFFFGDRHDITGGQAFEYKAMGVQLAKGDAHALSLVFDFGGIPAGTHVKISNIVFKKN
ncbi:MAG: hypothetical protein K6G73_09225 [Marinilabiliaceae bacterium]|nr:hypothetical protein [Marinilabiliaceae bacterium]